MPVTNLAQVERKRGDTRRCASHWRRNCDRIVCATSRSRCARSSLLHVESFHCYSRDLRTVGTSCRIVRHFSHYDNDAKYSRNTVWWHAPWSRRAIHARS
jgi:hypothetical protein